MTQITTELGYLQALMRVYDTNEYKVVDFRPAKKGEKLIDPLRDKKKVQTAMFDYTTPRFIVEEVYPYAPQEALEQIAELEDFELAEDEPRLPKEGEWMWNTYAKKPMKASWDFTTDHSWILKPVNLEFTDEELRTIARTFFYAKDIGESVHRKANKMLDKRRKSC